MQAIQTKTISATNTKGTRIKVSCEAKTFYCSWEYALNVEENHKAAAESMVKLMKWDKAERGYKGVTGGCFNGDYYWTFNE